MDSLEALIGLGAEIDVADNAEKAPLRRLGFEDFWSTVYSLGFLGSGFQGFRVSDLQLGL